MKSPTLTYRIDELPDVTCISSQLEIGGDIRNAVNQEGQHLLRTVSEFPEGCVSLVIRYMYHPVDADTGWQQRLAVQLSGKAHNPEGLPDFKLLLNSGTLHRIYRLQRERAFTIKWSQFTSCCDIVRRQSIIKPTVTGEFNPDAFPLYFAIDSFISNSNNDFARLDSLLNRLEKPVLIEYCVEPIDTGCYLMEHTRYLSQLQNVNRMRGSDEEELFRNNHLRGNNRWNLALKPLREKELLVEDIIRRQREFHRSLNLPHLRFHLRIYATHPEIARLVASVTAESAFLDGTYQLLDTNSNDPQYNRFIGGSRNLRAVPVNALERLLNDHQENLYTRFYGLASVATINELRGIFCLPVASYNSLKTIRKNTDPPPQGTKTMIILGNDQYSINGDNAGSHDGLGRGIPVDLLNKHVFVSGTTGSGKSTALNNMMIQLCDYEIPFICIDPAKSEFRVLKCLKKHSDRRVRKLAKKLRLYTAGNNISPILFNPLANLLGDSKFEHIENMMECFKSAMPMSGPLPGLLAEALEQVYEDFPDPDNPPRMMDLYAAARKVLAAKGYSGEVDSNLRGALEVRLGALTRRAIGQIFQCGLPDIPAMDELVNNQSIIEIHLPREQACQLILFLLKKIRAHIKNIPWSGKGIRLVIILEEAHVLVGPNTNAVASEDNANPQAYASALICTCLAELRALGVSFVIANQTASAIAPDVIKHTISKLAFNQLALDDREAIGNSMLFSEIEKEQIARLRPGQAYFITQGHHRPCLIRTPDLHSQLNLPEPPVGDAIIPYIKDDLWFIESTGKRIRALLGHLRIEMDCLDDKRKTIKNKITPLLQIYPRLLAEQPSPRQAEKMTSLAHRANILRKQLVTVIGAFRRDIYNPLMEYIPSQGVVDEHLLIFHQQLRERFESVITPTTQSYIGVLDSLIRKCNKTR